jgi:hypothetical protein
MLRVARNLGQSAAVNLDTARRCPAPFRGQAKAGADYGSGVLACMENCNAELAMHILEVVIFFALLAALTGCIVAAIKFFASLIGGKGSP